jgi:hypothetical protein
MILNWDWRSRYVSSRTMMMMEVLLGTIYMSSSATRKIMPSACAANANNHTGRPAGRALYLARSDDIHITDHLCWWGYGSQHLILFVLVREQCCVHRAPQRRVSDSSLHLYPQHCFAKTKLVPNVRGNLERFESHFDRGSWQGGIVWRNLLYGV